MDMHPELASDQRVQTPGPQLCMKRPGLDGLQEINLPAGYTIRASHEGEGHHWAGILREAFADNSFDEARFDREMKQHPAYDSDRIFFVCSSSGLPCGTASAYRDASFGETTGMLHYVGVRPSEAGKGLGMAVSLAALNRFREEGLESAFLQTDDHRLAAIKTYLRLGFLPLVVHESHPQRWNTVFIAMRRLHSCRSDG